MKDRLLSIIVVFVLLSRSAVAPAENWPGFRGSNGDGTSQETNLPIKWDNQTNVLWKVEVPGTGYASPIVWGDRLFTVTAVSRTHEKILLCFDTNNGSLLWKVTVLATPFEDKHNDNSFASGTPATDGSNIYVSFLDGTNVVVAAYDFTGKLVWEKRPGTYQSPHGYSCSPVLYKDMVIINGDSQGEAFIAALSKKDGHTVWKVRLNKPANDFSTPIIRELAGRMQMIFPGNREIASYNPDTGARYWFVEGPSQEFVGSPVYNEKTSLVMSSSSWPQCILLAINPIGWGDVSNSQVRWRTSRGAFYVPSPISTGDYLISTSPDGTVHCFDAATGKILWKERLGTQYASGVLAGGLVYMPNDEGIITVIKPGPTFETVAKNSMGEKMFTSPAISNGRIYLRGVNHLFCIGTK